MAKISVEANQCDVCGHVWLPSGKPAVQCAKCRSRKWNTMQCSHLWAGFTCVYCGARKSSIQPVNGPALFVEQQRKVVHNAHPVLERAMAGANNAGIMGLKWISPEDIPERTIEYEE